MTSILNEFEGGHNEEVLDRLRINADIEINRQDNQSRKIIAYWFTAGFIVLNTLIVVGVPIYNVFFGANYMLDVSEILAKFNGFFGTPLGFVLGYYFKK